MVNGEVKGDVTGANIINAQVLGTALVVQWLRLHLPMQGVRVPSLVRELGSHMAHGQKTKKNIKTEAIL